MMAARAAILPAGVSTVTSRPLQAMRLAGVDSASGTSLAELGDQRAQALAAGDRGVAILRAGLVDRRKRPSDPCRWHWRRARIPPCPPSRRGPSAAPTAQDTSALPREASSMARLARTSAARKSSVSPARALRRPMRIFWPSGAADDVEPGAARQLDHRVGVGIVHPARAAIERHLEGRGVGQAAAADLAGRLDHDHLAVRRLDSPRRGNAGRARRRSRQCRPRAATARAQARAPSTGVAAKAADADRKSRRVIVMSWFPKL